MNRRPERRLAQPKTRLAGPAAQSETSSARYFEVNVIFTTYRSTRRALQTAGNLARDLGVQINFIVPRVVPYAFPLTRPPVSGAFTERRFMAIAMDAAVKSKVNVLICNCRGPERAIVKILKPGSPVVIGGKERWWPTKATRLAARLRHEGHEVVFAENQENSRARPFLRVYRGAFFRHLLGLHEGL